MSTYKSRLTLADRFQNESTAWVVFAASLIITIFSWWLTNQYAEQRAHDRFSFEAHQASHAIFKRMQEYEQVLRGGVGLFVSSDTVTRQDWHDYVTNLQIETYWPGIQGIGYAAMVAPKQRESFIESIRQTGFPEFDIIPAGSRQQYSSIVYLEPFNARNQRAFGYDMFSERARQEAMIKARDSGQAALSSKVKLVQETDQDIQPGFLMYLPHYRRGAPVDSMAQRQVALIGYVYSPFRASDLMHGILGDDNPLIDFRVYDGNKTSDADLLYSSLAPSAEQISNPHYTITQAIELPGRTWTVRFDSSHIFEQQMETSQPLIIGIGGCTLDLLLLGILWSLAHNHKRATQSKREMGILLDRLEAAASAGIIGVWDWDVVNNKLIWDKVMYQLYGLRESDFKEVYEAWISALHPEDKKFIDNEIQAALRGEREYEPEFRVIWPDGTIHHLKALSHTTYDEQGKPIRMVGVNYDQTEQKNIQINLDKLASYDPLTKLPNRRLLDDRIDQAIARAHRENHKVAILFIDLDKFKQVNDIQGHSTGDWLLKNAAERIQHCLRSTDTVARIGGDEFIALLPDTDTNAINIAEKIRAALELPFVTDDGLALDISSSIGVAFYPDHADSAGELLRFGDEAMYQAKTKGRNNVVVYDLGTLESNLEGSIHKKSP